MGKKSIVLGIACIVLVFAMQATAWAVAWKVDVESYSGYVTYKESEDLSGTQLDSNWSAYLNRTGLALKEYDHESWEGEMRVGFSFTSEDSETWDVGGARYQTNDMKYWALDSGFLLGWAVPLDMGSSSEPNMYLTPLIGYNYKFMRFTRTNFNILNTITITDTVDEDFYIHALELGGKFDFMVNEKLALFVKPIWGIVLYDYAHNSIGGGIEGKEGSYYINLDTGVEYSIDENWVVGLLFRAEWQRLKGGNRDNEVFWPDNSLDAYGGEVNVAYRF
ncbi:MAG: hypothetical protein PHH49_06470 [Candidatus Omnitrophica bacterium]|nr:hypothetical protein [Candidatus Omnitrophota bacterium]MDD5488585.1 hypothetical protein [Candidatus Omnitrophota bacterium]